MPFLRSLWWSLLRKSFALLRRVILASIILAVPLPIHDLWIVAVHRTCTCVRFATASTRGELTGLTPLAPSPRTAGPEIVLPLFRDTALLAFHFHGSPRLARILWTVPDARNKIALWVNVGNRYPILPFLRLHLLPSPLFAPRAHLLPPSPPCVHPIKWSPPPLCSSVRPSVSCGHMFTTSNFTTSAANPLPLVLIPTNAHFHITWPHLLRASMA